MRVLVFSGVVVGSVEHVPNEVNGQKSVTCFSVNTGGGKLWSVDGLSSRRRSVTYKCRVYGELGRWAEMGVESGDRVSGVGEENFHYVDGRVVCWVTVWSMEVMSKRRDMVSGGVFEEEV